MSLVELSKQLKAMQGIRIRVGVLEENAARVHPNSKGETIGNIAVRNHAGIGNIPPRPFLAVTMNKRRGDIQDAYKQAAARVLGGELQPIEAADLIGLFAVGCVQETISEGVPPPNAQSTIIRKGSDKPLIDTGILRQSITYKVDK